MIEETHIGSGRHLPGSIRRPRDSTALLPIGHFDAAVLRGERRKNFADLRAIGTIVRNAQFPALIRLAKHGFDRGGKFLGNRVVHRHNNADRRLLRETLEL